jgi:hypothetical protein
VSVCSWKATRLPQLGQSIPRLNIRIEARSCVPQRHKQFLRMGRTTGGIGGGRNSRTLGGFHSKTHRGVVSIRVMYLNVHDKFDGVPKKSEVQVTLLVRSGVQNKPI